VANMLAHFAVTDNALVEIFVFDENVDMSIHSILTPYQILCRQSLFKSDAKTKRRAVVERRGTKFNFIYRNPSHFPYSLNYS